MKKMFSIALALALVPLAAPAFAAEEAGDYAAALADPARPPSDKARDAARKPAELLDFADVEEGDVVLDYIMGGGYLTRLLSATVGDEGKVYAYQPEEFIKFRAAYGAEQDAVVGAFKNIVPLRPSIGALTVPEPVDAIITVQNYHDLHLSMAPPGTAAFVAKGLFAALKPGGTLVVIDHVANAGTGSKDANTLHRIEPSFARAEIESAGFVFEEESTLWRNPADPHTALVFDPSIRGKTDQFAYKFKKPE